MFSTTSIFFATLVVSFNSAEVSCSPGVLVKPQLQKRIFLPAFSFGRKMEPHFGQNIIFT